MVSITALGTSQVLGKYQHLFFFSPLVFRHIIWVSFLCLHSSKMNALTHDRCPSPINMGKSNMMCELAPVPRMPQREVNTCLRIASPFPPELKWYPRQEEPACLQLCLNLPAPVTFGQLGCFERQGEYTVFLSIHSLPFVTLAHETKELNAKLQMRNRASALHRCQAGVAKRGVLKSIKTSVSQNLGDGIVSLGEPILLIYQALA